MFVLLTQLEVLPLQLSGLRSEPGDIIEGSVQVPPVPLPELSSVRITDSLEEFLEEKEAGVYQALYSWKKHFLHHIA